eukprot:g42209.t1
MPAPTASDTPVPSVTASDVRSVFLGINPKKATGPDGVPGRALRSCADQLVEVFTDIFNLSLLQAEVFTCFKKTTIIPVPKKAHAMCLNNYHPIALTSIIMKYFEKLVIAHINSSLPACHGPLQFAYRRNRSTADVISLVLHSSLEHLDNKDTHITLLLIDYSSIFNTIIPSRLISKLRDLGLGSALCKWILSFLTHRLQSVRIVLPNSEQMPSTDGTTIVGRISNNDESKYRRETEGLVTRCSENNLSLNVSKTKELIINIRNKGGEHVPICINGTEVERVKSIKFLGDRKKLQKVVCMAQTITETNLPSVDSIYTARCHGKVANIIKDSLHPELMGAGKMLVYMQKMWGGSWEEEE